MQLAQVQEHATRILDEVERAVVGKREALELVLLGLLADGHVLLEDYPGLAKTLTARSFAQVTQTGFNRIQFTPDLMPSDVTGSSIWNQRDGDFEFRPGPIFTNLLLADEINRAPPKTQAALLEAMQERQVTIEGVTHQLARPFLVLATQNPIEYEGTYPLPEAQLDRFLLRVSFGYPSRSDEWEVLSRRLERREDEVELNPVVDGQTLARSPGRDRGRPRRRCHRHLHRRPRHGDAHEHLDHRRRQPARQPRRAQARTLQGCARRPRLRHARGREGGRRPRPRPPADAEARALGAAAGRRGHRPRAARDRADAGSRSRPRRRPNEAGAVRATPSPRVTAYAVLAAVFLLAALGLRRPELAVLALPFALPLALGLRLARAPEIRVQVDVERATALENDELDVELTVSSEVPVERLELVLVVADGLEVVSGASAQSFRLGWEDERTLELKLRCARWGNYEIGDVRLRARDRLGLTIWESRVDREAAPARLPAPGDAAPDRQTRHDAALHGQRGRAAEGRGDGVRRPARCSPPATAFARSTGARAPAVTCSSSTSGIRSGTPT